MHEALMVEIKEEWHKGDETGYRDVVREEGIDYKNLDRTYQPCPSEWYLAVISIGVILSNAKNLSERPFAEFILSLSKPVLSVTKWSRRGLRVTVPLCQSLVA